MPFMRRFAPVLILAAIGIAVIFVLSLRAQQSDGALLPSRSLSSHE
jgi:hypothetical protein